MAKVKWTDEKLKLLREMVMWRSAKGTAYSLRQIARALRVNRPQLMKQMGWVK